jgi:hypothetical protein
MEAEVSEEPRQGRLAQLWSNLREGLGQLQWREVLLFGIASGVLMPLAFLQSSYLMFIAGIIPVGAGLLIGRRVKGHYTLHGFVTGLIGAVVSLILLTVVLLILPYGEQLSQQAIAAGAPAEQATPAALFVQFGGSTAFFLLAFVAFGASTAGRAEERNRQAREIVSDRGGRLERPNTIRTPDDIRGLSLPQFGSYVSNLFKKQGFQFKDYRFIDKDKHLDLWMEHEGELWRLRLTVADKVNPGTIEALLQEMKREGSRKGVVLTSTEFTPSATKAAKGRPVVLIDGATLYEIAEK